MRQMFYAQTKTTIESNDVPVCSTKENAQSNKSLLLRRAIKFTEQNLSLNNLQQ